MNAIVPRNTVEDIVRFRNQALELYEVAYGKVEEADTAIKAAADMAARAYPGINSYNYSHEGEIKAFSAAVTLPDKARYLRTARKLIDINCWAWIVERTDLERLMDAEAKKKLRNQMAYVPDRVNRQGELITENEVALGMPELTVENVVATLEQFMLDADMIFKRGIANVFSSLDRRFRSHDGFKIGSRLIITHMFDRDNGRLAWGRTRDQIIDVERVFSVLDGNSASSFTSALYQMDRDRSGTWNPTQSETETEYFKIRGFKNGNAHMWFQRDDLLEKVNKLLAEYYGEVIGDGQQAEEDFFASVKNLPAKRFGFYPTPEGMSKQIVDSASLYAEAGTPPLRVLEPSAGTGNLARLCVHDDKPDEGDSRRDRYLRRTIVDCVEIQPTLAAALTDEGIYNRVFCQDFMSVTPQMTGLYDRIVMNPPFDRERDIDHVAHAMKFLKPNGMLISIMSAGTEFRETKKAIAFRKLIESLRGGWSDLPAGTFSEVGTNVNTVAVKVWKDGTHVGWWRL